MQGLFSDSDVIQLIKNVDNATRSIYQQLTFQNCVVKSDYIYHESKFKGIRCKTKRRPLG